MVAHPITSILSIPTVADGSNTIGAIYIELLGDSNTADPSYMIAGDATVNTKVVTVSTLPIRTITIEASEVNINEAGTATITLTADGQSNA